LETQAAHAEHDRNDAGGDRACDHEAVFLDSGGAGLPHAWTRERVVPISELGVWDFDPKPLLRSGLAGQRPALW